MDIGRRAKHRQAPEWPSQTELRVLQRLEHIAIKGLLDPDALSRVEILEVCKLAYGRLTESAEWLEMRRRSEAVAEMVRLSQELGLE